ncbi:MAG TPA: GNAT family N-acetyltransferase [Candidatus Egerieicola pullicola]|uniref:GNAT family N-acetyltransferase n=1 Tax=Candidatus Egerieicola pullicola TaxID=2840775 RepID=A0A9D1AJH2_9FIRM|nr:GNAT family N-acetyltransferase [Candidatus Egerieicola pullicola]
MNLRWAKVKDVDRLAALDRHLSPGQLAQAVEQGRVLTAWDGQVLAGWLRYGWFWDNTPFLNLLFVQKEYRGQGWGNLLLRRWEEEMKRQGFSVLLTSTQAQEQSQHFYRHFGYRDVGGFLLPPEPYELILAKNI